MKVHTLTRLGAATVFLILTSFCLALPKGIVERISPQGVAIEGSGAYVRSEEVAVTLLSGSKGKWEDIRVGDYVDLTLDAKQHVTEVRILPAVVKERVEKSLLEIEPITGSLRNFSGNEVKAATVAGRRFDRACVMYFLGRSESLLVFPIDGKVDQVELWFGGDDERRSRSTVDVEIKGDDEVLQRISAIRQGDKAKHIILPIRGYRSMSIAVKKIGEYDFNLVIGEPILVTLPSMVPSLVSPALNERIKETVPLVWRGASEASGYLVEVQCIEVTDPADVTRTDRFQTVLYPASSTVHQFDGSKLPKGKWRWRVHSLGGKGIIGEMKEWSFFTNG